MNTTKRRFQIESIIVKSNVLERVKRSEETGDPKKYVEIDPDLDTASLIEHRETLDAAVQRANEIYQRDCVEMSRSCWGIVTVQEERYVQPYEEYPQVWDWEPVGESIEVS